MKTVINENKKLSLNLATSLSLAASLLIAAQSPVFAREGGGSGVGGGGDASEPRVDEIRADILKWISAGGGQGLKFPQRLSYESYRSSMTEVLAPHAVVIGFVTTDQESKTFDPNLKVSVDGQPKTCRGFVAYGDPLPHLLCNTERFAAASQAEQYRLVHHEFAGLAGAEQNVGASSDYGVSNQITDYLVPETVLRLAVKEVASTSIQPATLVSEYDLVASQGAYCNSEMHISLNIDEDEFVFFSHRYGIYKPVEISRPSQQTQNGITNCTTQAIIEVQGNRTVLMQKERCAEALFGVIPLPSLLGKAIYDRIDLISISPGKLQVVDYNINHRANKYVVNSNCLYQRRKK
ncbi:hypothetical protein WDW37_04075 [Bdellovibrionota bacterium FG-1]